MKLATLALGLMALTYFPVGSYAQSAKPASQEILSSTSKRALEDYYFHVNIGFPINNYPTETQAAIKDVNAISGIIHLPFSAEFGVYWPIMNDHTIVGVVGTGTGDTYTKSNTTVALEVGQFSVSAQHYLTNIIGDGLYVRGDVGLAAAYLHRETVNNEGRDESAENSSGNLGISLLGSVGYALPLSSGTSLSFSVNANYRRLPGYRTGEYVDGGDIFERGDYTSVVFGANLLW